MEELTETEVVIDDNKKNSYKVAIGLSGKVYDDSENVSLQDSFKKFRDAKARERKLMKSYKENSNGERTEGFKAVLRNKFIEQSKKYFGVPYHVKYKDPEAEPAPLYLDCCGLVRQVVRDLSDDFGFLMAKWNQAYQFDMLPKNISFEELKPGDLIFYEGIYNSNRSKPQKHNMVHVEIFVGGSTGEATIGARFQKGVIKQFESYQFKSTTWDLVQYHFKSIDVWLEGKHESYCSEHPWHSEALALMAAAGKRSIFNDLTDEDESAGGMDEDEQLSRPQSRAIIQSDSEIISSSMCLPCESPRDVLIQQQAKELDYLRKELAAQKAIARGEVAMNAPAYCQEPIDTDSSKTPLKNNPVNKASSGLSRSIEQLPSTPSLSESPLRTKSITPMRGPRVRVAKSMELKKAIPLTYYVCKANGWKLWKEALDKRGWQQLPFDYKFTTSYGLKYVEGRGQIDFKAHIPGQLVCHIPNNNVITTKMELLQTMRDAYSRPPASTTGPSNASAESIRIPTPWVPETYMLSLPADCAALLDVQRCNDLLPQPENLIWIYKPSSSNRGRGLRVLKGMENLRELVCQEDNPGGPPKNRNGIVQHYLTDPLLIEGFKFDVRCYMLVARNAPSYVALYHPGYCRMTLKPFSMTAESLEDSSIHLTNAAIQKHTPEYQDRKEFQIQTPEAVADTIERGGNVAGATYIRERMDHDIKCCMVDVLKAAMPKLTRKHGYFDLFGLDFMVTNDNKLVLLEVNTNPALSLDNSTLAAILPGVVDSTVDLVLRLQGPERSDIAAGTVDQALDDAVLATLPGRFQPLLVEKNKFRYS